MYIYTNQYLIKYEYEYKYTSLHLLPNVVEKVVRHKLALTVLGPQPLLIQLLQLRLRDS